MFHTYRVFHKILDLKTSDIYIFIIIIKNQNFQQNGELRMNFDFSNDFQWQFGKIWYHEKLYNFTQNIQKIIFKGLTTNDFSQILKTDEYK